MADSAPGPGLTGAERRALLRAARNEITEHRIYRSVAARSTDADNRRVLETIADDELRHHRRLTELLGTEAAPRRLRIRLYVGCARLFEVAEAIADEQRHEEELLRLLQTGEPRYAGSFVLGLNDALVELTGALAGLTLALRDTRLIGVVALITGLAATMAMAASEYLATQEEGSERSPAKAATVTGFAYMVTALFLVAPFLLLGSALVALAISLGVGVLIVLAFTFYTATAKGVSFPRRFRQMAVISLGVAAVNFGIGYLINRAFDL